MDATLLRAVRMRMESQNSDQLLAIWVANDQDQYSEEAFEAARLILKDRGVELPPQNEPIKNVPEIKPAVDPYWVSWLRVVLIVGIALGTATLLVGIAEMASGFRDPYGRLTGAWKTGPLALVNSVLTIYTAHVASPLALGVGIVLCWRLKPIGRVILMIYAWLALGLCALEYISSIWKLNRPFIDQLPWQAMAGERLIQGMVYPVILLLFLTRSQIRNVFVPSRRGFDATMPPIQPKG